MLKDPKTGVDIKGASHMTYGNEKIASMTYSNGSFYQAKYQVWGTKGIISLERAYSLPADFKTSVDIQYNATQLIGQVQKMKLLRLIQQIIFL